MPTLDRHPAWHDEIVKEPQPELVSAYSLCPLLHMGVGLAPVWDLLINEVQMVQIY